MFSCVWQRFHSTDTNKTQRHVIRPAKRQRHLSKACVTKDNLDDIEYNSGIRAERRTTEEQLYTVERQLQLAICSVSTQPRGTHT